MVRYLFYTIGDLTYQSPLVVNSTDRTSNLVSSHKKILFLPSRATADKVLVLALECEMGTHLWNKECSVAILL